MIHIVKTDDINLFLARMFSFLLYLCMIILYLVKYRKHILSKKLYNFLFINILPLNRTIVNKINNLCIYFDILRLIHIKLSNVRHISNIA